MKTQCNARPYEGTEAFLMLWYSPADEAVCATMVETLVRDGYRVWYPENPGEQLVQVNERLSRCCGVLGLYSQAAMQEHDFRKVLTSAVLQGKPIAAVILRNAVPSPGMLCQLGNAPRLPYLQQTDFQTELADIFAQAKGSPKAAQAVIWCDEAKPEVHPVWPVSQLDDGYGFEEKIEAVAEGTILKSDDDFKEVHMPQSKEEVQPPFKQPDIQMPSRRDTVIENELGESKKRITVLEEPHIQGGGTVFLYDQTPKLIDLATGELFTGRSGITTVGRSENCDITFPREGVSSMHVRIISMDGQHGKYNALEDADSTNGTWLDGTRMEKGGKEQIQGQIAFVCLSRRIETMIAFDDMAERFRAGMWIAVMKCVETGEFHLLTCGETPLGCENDWPGHSLDEPHISWQHATVTFDGTSLSLRDVGSSNGTYLNGKRIAVHENVALKDGDALRLGWRHFSVMFKQLINH